MDDTLLYFELDRWIEIRFMIMMMSETTTPGMIIASA